MSDGGPEFPRPPVLTAAAVLLGLQAGTGAAFGVRDVVSSVSGGLLAVGPAVYLLLYAAVLVALARGVALGRRWSRAPALAFQVLHLPIAWSLRQAEPGWAVLLFAVGSAAVIALLVSPPATAVFVEERG